MWLKKLPHTLLTAQLDWPPDVVDRFTEEARKKGLYSPAEELERRSYR
jgi:hypothetical protein